MNGPIFIWYNFKRVYPLERTYREVKITRDYDALINFGWFFKFLPNKRSLFASEYTSNFAKFSTNLATSSICVVSHVGGPGSIPSLDRPLWKLVTLKLLELQQWISHGRKKEVSLKRSRKSFDFSSIPADLLL